MGDTDIQYADAWGNVVDTGCAVKPTVRANTEVDYHTLAGVTEADPARADKTLKLPSPHRPVGHPR
jgi:hypothetical protein